jgi:hypothetical protein
MVLFSIQIYSPFSEADVIVLKDGKEIEVERAYIDRDKVIGVNEEETQSFPLKSVKKIYKKENSGSVLSPDGKSKYEILLKDERSIIVRNFWEEDGYIIYEKYGATIKLPASKIQKITKIEHDPNFETVEYEGSKKNYKKKHRNSWEDLGPPGSTFYNPARE